MKIKVQRFYDARLKLEIEIQRYPDGRFKLLKGSSENYEFWIDENGVNMSMSKDKKLERIVREQVTL